MDFDDLRQDDDCTNRDGDDRQPLLFNAVTNSLQRASSDSTSEYQTTYCWRWYMLAVMAVLNLSNGMLWMSFSSIADSTAKYFDVDQMQVNWLSIVFMVATIVIGVGVMWILDHCGLRTTLLIAAWLNVFGSVGRIISILLTCHECRYAILLTSQTVCACAQPFVMFSPTKLAAQWFPERQRTFANMIASTANPVGIMLGSILSAVIVPNSEASDKIPLMLHVFACPAYVGVLMTTFGVCSSVPPSPPSSSAAMPLEQFFVGVKQLIKSRSYWILAVCFGGGIGLLSTLVTILDQLLCPHDYSDSFVGLCICLLFGVGLFGAVIMSLVVDATRKFEETAKIGFGLCACSLIALVTLGQYANLEVALGLLCATSGFFGLALYPVCLELSVECSFPVGEGTAAGFLCLSGQLQAALYSIIMSVGLNTVTSRSEMCHSGQIISIYAVVFFLVATGVLTLSFILFFRSDYRRLRFEEQIEAENTVSSQADQGVISS